MRCRTARQLMCSHIDSSLDPERMAWLSRHVESCAGCQATWTAVQEVDHMLQAAPYVDPPQGLVQGILERLPQDRRAVAAPTPVWVRAGTLVMAALAFLLVGLSGATLLLGLSPSQEEWALIRQGGWNAIVAGWSSVRGLFTALTHVVQALWQALRWPWAPLFILTVAAAAGLWVWLWRSGKKLVSSQ